MTSLSALPFVPTKNRKPRGSRVDLIVVHTNEGQEGARSAEGLASYLQHADPGYNVVLDEDSAVRCALDSEAVWGAGGVNSRAWHLCITGFAAQSGAQWHDQSSKSAGLIAADLVRQACVLFDVPVLKVHDTRTGGQRGICGHADVSAYHSESMGHTDPGPNFPWTEFIQSVAGQVAPAPTERKVHRVTEFFFRDGRGTIGPKGAIYLVSGNSRTHQSAGQKQLYAWAAWHETPNRVIVDLGDVSDAQLLDLARIPLVGAA